MRFNPELLLAAAIAIAGAGCIGCDDTTSARETHSAVAVEKAAAAAKDGAGGAPSADRAAASAGEAQTIVETTFDDIKFPMEKSELFERSMLTEKVQSLFGRRIRIRGYMFPTLRKRGLKEFVLVRDNMECCFGPGAALFDCILVRMDEGKSAEFSIRPIAVAGEFRLDEYLGPDGRPLAIYQMTAESVE